MFILSERSTTQKIVKFTRKFVIAYKKDILTHGEIYIKSQTFLERKYTYLFCECYIKI